MKKCLWWVLAFSFSLIAAAHECREEQAEFCADITPGKGQLIKCLNEHQSSLGAACKRELNAFVSKTKKANPCFEELSEYCTDVPANGERLTLCLLKHESRLGDSCRSDLSKKKDRFMVTEPCAQDIIDKCYGAISEAEGMTLRCLIKHKGKLLARCETAMGAKIQRIRAINPCFDDTEKFCPGTVNRGEIDACLSKKTPQLTKTCQTYIVREQKIAQKNPCHNDLKRHCRPNISPNGQFRCLELHDDKLSNACRQLRKGKKDNLKKMQELCEGDRLKFCAKEPHSGGKIIQCLRKNRSKVSKNCATAITK